MESENIIDIQNLSVSFKTDQGTIKAVDNVSFSVKKGEILGIVGESGSGKSITALSILRLIPLPDGKIESGKIIFDGEDLLSVRISKMKNIRGKQISMIFQEPMSALSPLHKIGNQLVEVLQLHNKINRKEALNISESWLKKVGIPDAKQRMNVYPYQLSGGMQQRVMIAMALMLNPVLVIADEPTTALDVTIQAQIFDLMRQMKKNSTSLMLITHDMGVIWDMCNRMIVMYASNIVEQGYVSDIFKKPAHPYTIGLLNSIPMLNKQIDKLPVITGQVPSPFEKIYGCKFFDRCPYAFERCAFEKPPFIEIDSNRNVACFLEDKFIK